MAFVEPESSNLVMKIGEIASPRMNFTSFRDDLLVEQMEDALCQVSERIFKNYFKNPICPPYIILPLLIVTNK